MNGQLMRSLLDHDVLNKPSVGVVVRYDPVMVALGQPRA